MKGHGSKNDDGYSRWYSDVFRGHPSEILSNNSGGVFANEGLNQVPHRPTWSVRADMRALYSYCGLELGFPAPPIRWRHALSEAFLGRQNKVVEF